MDFPSAADQDVGLEPNPDDLHPRDGSVGGGGIDVWSHRVSGVESDEHAGRARHARHASQRGHRPDHRRGLATDPEVGGDGAPFSFQLDDGRLPVTAGGGGGGGVIIGASSLSTPLDWMAGGGAGEVDDPEGVHKRSLNGTSKGVPPAAGASPGTASPRDEGDLIRRVACEEPPGVLQQQPAQVREKVCSA